MAGVIEFAFVLHLHHYNEAQAAKQAGLRWWNVNGGSPEENGDARYQHSTKKFNIKKIDRIAFIVSQLSLLFFNIIYFFIFKTFNFN